MKVSFVLSRLSSRVWKIALAFAIPIYFRTNDVPPPPLIDGDTIQEIPHQTTVPGVSYPFETKGGPR